MAIAGAALLVLGIILCVTAVALPLGIACIVAGVALLVTAAALNWDTIKDKVKGVLAKIGEIVSKVLLVLGVILCISGVGIPIGLALIAAGAAMLKKANPEDYNALVDKVKEVLGKIKTIFSDIWDKIVNKTKETIDKIKDWFSGLPQPVQRIIASVLNFFIRGLNWAIEKANKMIQGINGLDIFGYSPNLKYIPYIPEVQVPALAKGAVIPGGSPFLAMLGDQRKGQTNIETPLETMIEAFKQAQQDTNINVHFTGTMSQLVRMLNPQIQKEQKRASIW